MAQMDMAFMNQLRRAWIAAQRKGLGPTHWLMTRAAIDRLRHENRDRLSYPAGDTAKTYMGLPIYVTDDLDPPGFLLRQGDPPDDLREAELRDQLHTIQRKYQDLVRPIVDELARLEARKPPARQLFPSKLGGMTVPPR